MRAPEHMAFLDAVRPLTEAYRPNDKVLDETSRLSIAAIIGPFGVGKNTLMEASGLPIVTSITSRVARPSDTNYRVYLDFSRADHRDTTLRQLQDRQWVQASSHPATNELYGAELIDFPVKPSLFDITSYEYGKLRQADIFGNLFGVCVTAPPAAWHDRTIQRDGISAEDREKRLVEGRDSLKYCLDDPNMLFIVNDDLETAAAQLGPLVYGQIDPAQQKVGREMAQLMLTGFEDIILAA